MNINGPNHHSIGDTEGLNYSNHFRQIEEAAQEEDDEGMHPNTLVAAPSEYESTPVVQS